MFNVEESCDEQTEEEEHCESKDSEDSCNCADYGGHGDEEGNDEYAGSGDGEEHGQQEVRKADESNAGFVERLHDVLLSSSGAFLAS